MAYGYGLLLALYGQGKTEIPGEKPIRIPFGLPQPPMTWPGIETGSPH